MPKKNIIEVIIKGEDQASAVLGKIGGAVSGLGGIAAGVATGGLALAAAAVVGLGAAAVGATIGITKLAMAAAEVEGTRLTFERLTDEYGGAAVAMDKLQEATRGMVGEADLMAASNKFLTMGIAENTEETAKLAEMATQLGLAMGEDATASMENFALMMANQSIPRLDSFGISSATVRERMKELTKATEASGISQADWDEKVEKSTNRLTDLRNKLHLAGIKQSEWTDKTKESTRVAHAQRIEKITRQIAEQETEMSNLMATTIGITEASVAMTREEAFKIAVLEQGAIAMEKVGEQGDNATATTLRWKAAIADLGLGIGQAFIPALEAIRKPIVELVDKYGPDIILWAETIGDWLAERIPDAIKRLEGAWTRYWPEASSTLTDFWEKIKPGLEWVRDMFQKFTVTYLPHLRAAWDILKEGFDEVVELYNVLLKPALAELWDALGLGQTKSEDVAEGFGEFMGVLTRLMASGVIELIKFGIWGITQAVTAAKIGIDLFKMGIIIAEHVMNRIKGTVDRIKRAFEGVLWVFNEVRHWISVLVEKFNHFKSTLARFQLPWWLRPGSPTPLETGLAGIGEALAKVQDLAGGGLAFGGMTLAGAGAGAGGGVTTISIVNYFGPDSVRSDEDILDIADAISQELELRGIGPVL